MGEVFFGIPEELVRRLVSGLGLQVAIETGTYRGRTARRLRSVCERVISIELSPELYASARSTIPDVEFCLGSSSEELPKVLRKLDSPALFWLDAHFCGSISAGLEDQCPVLAEIKAIDEFPFASDSCILIDDARVFLGPLPPPYRREDWPPFMDVMDLLRQTHPRFVTVLEDVIVAVPPGARGLVEDYWLAVLADKKKVTLARLANRAREVGGRVLARNRLGRHVLARYQLAHFDYLARQERRRRESAVNEG